MLNDQNANGATALHIFALNCDTTGTQQQINAGANLNIQDLYLDTPLHNSIYSLCPSILTLLLQAGANSAINNKNGNDALGVCVAIFVSNITTLQSKAKLLELIKILLSFGANPNVVNGIGYAILHTAVTQSFEMTKILLENNANPNVEDLDGNPPLTHAVYSLNVPTATLLVKFGALNIQGLFLKTPLDYACFYGHTKLIELLKPVQIQRCKNRKNVMIAAPREFPFLNIRNFK